VSDSPQLKEPERADASGAAPAAGVSADPLSATDPAPVELQVTEIKNKNSKRDIEK